MNHTARIRRALAGDDTLLHDPDGFRWTAALLLEGGGVDPILAGQLFEFHYRRFRVSGDDRDLYLGVTLASTIDPESVPIEFTLAATILREAEGPDEACDLAVQWASDPATFITVEKIDQLVVVWRWLRLSVPSDHPLQPKLNRNYSTVLFYRWQLVGDSADLHRAVMCAATAVDLTAADDPNLGVRSAQLVEVLRHLANAGGSAAQLRTAINIGTRALSVVGEDPDLLCAIGHCCLSLNLETDDPHAADDAIRYAIRAHVTAAHARPDIVELAVLATFNLVRTSTQPPDLTEVLPLCDQSVDEEPGILALRCAIDAVLSASPDHSARLTSAIDLGQRALEIGAEPATAVTIHDRLGTACYRRFRVTQESALLDLAITHGERYVALTEDHPGAIDNIDDIAVAQINLATRLNQRHQTMGRREDLALAIDYTRRSLDDRSGVETRLLRRAGILIGLLATLAQNDDPAAGAEAVEIGLRYRTIAERSAMDIGFYQNFANAAKLRFDVDPSTENLDVAIDAMDASSALNIDDISRRNLIQLLVTRYERIGGQTDLRRAVVLADLTLRDQGVEVRRLEPLLTIVLAGSPEVGITLAEIGMLAKGVAGNPGKSVDVLRALFAAEPTVDRVDQLVAAAEQIAQESDDAIPADELLSLALELRLVHLDRGDRRSIDEAVRWGREWLRRHPADPPARPIELSSLAVLHRNRYLVTGQPTDLDEAIRLGMEAVEFHPIATSDTRGLHSNLAGALRDRFDRTGRIADLNGAIELLRTEAAAPGPPLLQYEGNLGAALLVRYMNLGARPDLDEAIQRLTTAANALDDPSSEVDSTILSALANAQLTHAGLTGSAADLQ